MTRLRGKRGLGWIILAVFAAACAGDAKKSDKQPAADAGSGGSTGSGGSAAADAGPVNPALGCPMQGPTREQLGDALEPMPAVTGVRELRVTPKGLHWTSDKVYRLGEDGRAIVVSETKGPDTLATSDSAIAWHGVIDDKEGIWSTPLGADAATPTLAVKGATLLEILAIDATHAYYYDGFASDGLTRAPLAGGSEPETIGTAFGVQDIVLEGGYAYYAEKLGHVVMRVPIGGGATETLTPEIGLVHYIALDADAIYVSGGIGIRRIERNDPTSDLLLLRLASSSVTIDNSLTRMLVDGERIVFVDREDNVGWVSKDGKDCGYIIAAFAEVGAVPRTDIALDASYLYLIDLEASALYRIARAAIGLDG